MMSCFVTENERWRDFSIAHTLSSRRMPHQLATECIPRTGIPSCRAVGGGMPTQHLFLNLESMCACCVYTPTTPCSSLAGPMFIHQACTHTSIITHTYMGCTHASYLVNARHHQELWRERLGGDQEGVLPVRDRAAQVPQRHAALARLRRIRQGHWRKQDPVTHIRKVRAWGRVGGRVRVHVDGWAGARGGG